MDERAPTTEPSPIEEQLLEDLRRRKAAAGGRMPRPLSTRIITVSNQKGGVGKTTSAVNIAAALAGGGLRVLVIDDDPQGNASTALGIDHPAGTPSTYDVMINDGPLSEIIQPCPDVDRLFCAPSTIDLSGAEIELVDVDRRERRLKDAIETMLADPEAPAFDYILIDCPPSLGLLTLNAFVAAREVLIPIQCEYYALEGLSMLLRNVDLIRKAMNTELRVSTILLTMFDKRTNLSRQVAEDVKSYFPAETLETTIPRLVRISEAPGFGQTIITFDPPSTGAIAYKAAAREIAERGAKE